MCYVLTVWRKSTKWCPWKIGIITPCMIMIVHFKITVFVEATSGSVLSASEFWNEIIIKDVIIPAGLLIMVIMVIIATAHAGNNVGLDKLQANCSKQRLVLSVCRLSIPHLAG